MIEPQFAIHFLEIDRDDLGEHDHEHGFGWLDIVRAVSVSLAAATVWFHL